MEKQTGKGDGNDIGDCSDNDLNKGSDDAMNVVISPKQTSNIHSVLPYKINYICTMVSVIGIVVMIVMLIVISNDDKQNVFQLTTLTDISRLSNQLKSLSSKIDSHRPSADGQQTCEKINTSYLYYALQEENRKLRAELQKTKSRKVSITCVDTENKRKLDEGRKEQLEVSCNSVSSANNIYGWIVANRSLSFGSSDHFNIIIQFKLLYPDISDNGKVIFEFGLSTLSDHLELNCPAIIVRGQRCEKEPGMCLYVKDNTSTKLEVHVFDQMSDYKQGQLTLELHKSYFVLMSNQKNIYISNTVNLSSKVKLWPVFGFYNTHLINISQTILSENKISFNRTTVDPHLFVSEDNSTISSCKLWPKETSFSRWNIIIMFIEIVFFFVFIILVFFLELIKQNSNEDLQTVAGILILMLFFVGVPLSLYYLYTNWSLYLLSVVSTLLGILLYNLKYKTFGSDPKRYAIFTFLDSTYIMILFKMLRYIFFLIFY